MSNTMIYSDAEWPHGVRCAVCLEPFTEGQLMAERLDAFQGDALIIEVVHATCESTRSTEETE